MSKTLSQLSSELNDSNNEGFRKRNPHLFRGDQPWLCAGCQSHFTVKEIVGLPPEHCPKCGRALIFAGRSAEGQTQRAEPGPERGTIYEEPRSASKSAEEKPLLNGLETKYRNVLRQRQYTRILEQAIRLRLDPPFCFYTPDLAYFNQDGLVFVECKGPHRFREKGIAKAALAAKTYSCFTFVLVELKNGEWVETRLSS